MKLWIARDKDGDLWLFSGEPTKREDVWGNKQGYFGRSILQLSADLFPDVQWEDDEPTEVELKIVKK